VPCTCCNRCLLNVLEHPLGCYDRQRFESYDAMIEHVMSFYEDGPQYQPSRVNRSFPGLMVQNLYPGWKRLFLIKAVYNVLIALGISLLLRFWPEVFSHPSMRAPADARPIFYLLLAHVLVFGFGFWRVSRNVTKNLDIIKMGALIDSFVFVIAAYYTYRGEIGPLLGWTTAIIDLVFAITFAIFLARSKTSGSFLEER